MSDLTPTDVELVRRSAAGDQDAFQVLFERKHTRAYLTAYQMLGDRSLAEEVVQEAFLALWRHCARYRAEFAVDTWLRRIVTSRAIDRWRSEKRHSEHRATNRTEAGELLDLLEATREREADPTLLARWREVQELWDRCAADLPPQQRAAFALREIEGHDPADVALAMGCSVSTVRTHVSLARKALRKRIAAELGEVAYPTRH